MTEAFSTSRLEELGIDIDPERVLVVDSLLGLCRQKLGISFQEIVERVSSLSRKDSSSKHEVTATFARSSCAGKDPEAQENHVCMQCSFSALGSIATNQAEIFLMYDRNGFAIGIDYMVAGNESPIASLELNATAQDWSDEKTALLATYSDEVLIAGDLIGRQPMDCAAFAANSATVLPFEVGR